MGHTAATAWCATKQKSCKGNKAHRQRFGLFLTHQLHEDMKVICTANHFVHELLHTWAALVVTLPWTSSTSLANRLTRSPVLPSTKSQTHNTATRESGGKGEVCSARYYCSHTLIRAASQKNLTHHYCSDEHKTNKGSWEKQI